MRTIHPFCSVAFQWHRLRSEGSKQSPEFKCKGYCRFEDCPITFTVTVKSADNLKAKKLAKINEDVMESGCRDEAPTPRVLKSISWEVRQRSRLHSSDMLSLQIMLETKKNTPEEVLQKVFLHPKGVLLWSLRSIEIFQERCREDIIYLDATGSIKKKEKGSPPFYVYELVVRHPTKKCSPLPVATYLTCDHTTASVLYFLEAFQTDVARCYGRKGLRAPIMLMCDGSMVLMQAICL